MVSSKVLDEVKTAMINYYTWLSRMPHFPPDSLLRPPPEGWSDMNVDILRKRGRSEAAIEFARHLPCLKPCMNSERAWINSGCRAIAFHRGEVWPSWVDTGRAPPTPPHLFYLSLPIDAREGTYLCVDTEQGTIVELAGALKEDLTWDDVENLPNSEQWTAYRALPAKQYFERQTLSVIYLFEMPVPPPPSRNSLSQPMFYERARNQIEEEEIRGADDEWEADHEDDPDYVEGGNETSPHTQLEQLQLEHDNGDVVIDDADLDEDEDMSVDTEEIEDLRADTEEYDRLHSSPSGAGGGIWKPAEPLPEENLRVYDIYKRNGWPYDYFDVEQCRIELLDFAQELDDGRKARREEYDRTRPKTAKEWAEDRRQRIKQIWVQQGKAWDEEKEKSQSAEEWLAEFQSASRKQW